MLITEFHESLESVLRKQFECSPVPGEQVQVQTPLLFPDGDMVDVFVLEQDGRLVVTDYGDTLSWLSSQFWEPGFTDAEMRIAKEVCRSLGVEFNRGQLEINADSLADAADAVLSVAQAAVRISDRCYIHRMPARLFPSDDAAANDAAR